MSDKPVRVYANKDEMFNIVKAYKERLKENPKEKIPEQIGRVIILIVDKILSKFSYRGYTFKDEMRSEAILACVTAIPKFDADRSDNVFGFLTTTIHWKIHAIIRKENERKSNELGPFHQIDELLVVHSSVLVKVCYSDHLFYLRICYIPRVNLCCNFS